MKYLVIAFFTLLSSEKAILEKKTFTLFSSEIVGAYPPLHYVTTATLNEIDTSRLTA